MNYRIAAGMQTRCPSLLAPRLPGSPPLASRRTSSWTPASTTTPASGSSSSSTPLDFGYVSQSELLELEARRPELESLDCRYNINLIPSIIFILSYSRLLAISQGSVVVNPGYGLRRLNLQMLCFTVLKRRVCCENLL